ncbi:MAG: thiamine-phosphate kinase [Nitrospirae bacterium]|nr:thiamine-phosphate kinase [Nitrospirota bacterium]
MGIGDDAAVIDPRKEKVLITTDMMHEGIHFDLSFTAPFQLGFKLVSVNVSDIMAMGGQPRYLFLNIAVKKDVDEVFFWNLFEGISEAMGIYGVKLLGGDLSSAANDMVLSATVIGGGDKIITRGGASVGDKIYVTSTTGDSACGLEILKRLTPESKKAVAVLGDKKAKDFPDLILSVGPDRLTLEWDIAEPLLRRHLMPVARDSSRLVPYAKAMIDVSDGLFIDLSRMCDESNAGARIYLDRIPISDEMRYAAGIIGLDPLSLATSGGEDYELLFTAPVGLIEEDSAVKATCIGEIIEKDRIVVDSTGRESAMKVEGYQHFGSS